jgi:hypothetical protein
MSGSDSEGDELRPAHRAAHPPAPPRHNGETFWLPVDPSVAAAAAGAAGVDAGAFPTPRSFIRFASELRREVTIPERYRRRATAEDGPGGTDAGRSAGRAGESAGILGPWSFGIERPDSRQAGDAAAARVAAAEHAASL